MHENVSRGGAPQAVIRRGEAMIRGDGPATPAAAARRTSEVFAARPLLPWRPGDILMAVTVGLQIPPARSGRPGRRAILGGHDPAAAAIPGRMWADHAPRGGLGGPP